MIGYQTDKVSSMHENLEPIKQSFSTINFMFEFIFYLP